LAERRTMPSVVAFIKHGERLVFCLLHDSEFTNENFSSFPYLCASTRPFRILSLLKDCHQWSSSK
jgi:hypothetical protein